MKKSWASVFILSLVVVWVSPCAVGAQIATGQISGTVVNQNGEPLPGASVTGRNVDTGFEREVISAANGRFTLLSLPRGTYQVRVESEGFQSVVREGLLLNIGQDIVLDFELKVAATSETLTVTGDAPIFSTTQGVLGTTIQTETIDSIPSLGRDYREFTKLVPGVRKEETGSPRIGGQAYYANTWKIDGLANDSEAVGNPQARITQDAIAELQVSTNQYSAEMGRALGGAINVITRSGTNDFRGRGFYYTQDESWNATGAFATSKPKNQTDQFGATFGGPIAKDRTHFFASAESIDNSRNTTLLDPAGGPSQTLNRPTEQLTAFAKIDTQFGPSHTFNAQYLYDDLLADGEGVGGTSQPSHGFERSIENSFFILSDVGVLSSTIVNELRFQYQLRDQLSTPNTAVGPEIRRPSSVTGRDAGLPFGWNEDKIQIADTLTRMSANHEFKIGINYQQLISSDWLNESFFGGQYVFDTDRPFDPNDATTYPVRYTVASGDATTSLNNKIYGVFFQDSWTATDDLTLNLGIRYDREEGDAVDVFKGFPDDDNFAPRLSFAWNPGEGRKTTVRGGLGRFYYRLYSNLGVNLIVQGAPPPDGLGTTVQTAIVNPGYPDPFGFNPNGSSLVPQGLKQGHFSDGNEETGYTDQVSIGVGQQLGRNLAISADIVSSRGKHLSRAFDTNYPDPVTGLRPRPDYSQYVRYDTNGRNWYDALLVNLTKRMSDNYSYSVSYTLSDTEDDTWPQFITQFGAGPQAWYNLGAERAKSASSGLNADDHERHRLVLSGVYQLPLGFNVSGVWVYHSPRRYNIVTGRDNNLDGVFADRPNFENGQYVDPGTGYGVQGNVGRNEGEGNSYDSLDLRISKDFSLGGDRRLTIIAEAFNALNKTNPGGYFGSIASASFGEPSFYQRKRQVQLGLQFEF